MRDGPTPLSWPPPPWASPLSIVRRALQAVLAAELTGADYLHTYAGMAMAACNELEAQLGQAMAACNELEAQLGQLADGDPDGLEHDQPREHARRDHE